MAREGKDPVEGEIPLSAQVYDLVRAIPPGKVATYGQLAERVGHGLDPREVGYIMARAGGHDVPAHRVVGHTGALAPDYVFGGQEKQRAMLEREGVTFLADGRIDMRRHQWGKGEQLSFF